MSQDVTPRETLIDGVKYMIKPDDDVDERQTICLLLDGKEVGEMDPDGEAMWTDEYSPIHYQRSKSVYFKRWQTSN